MKIYDQMLIVPLNHSISRCLTLFRIRSRLNIVRYENFFGSFPCLRSFQQLKQIWNVLVELFMRAHELTFMH